MPGIPTHKPVTQADYDANGRLCRSLAKHSDLPDSRRRTLRDIADGCTFLAIRAPRAKPRTPVGYDTAGEPVYAGSPC